MWIEKLSVENFRLFEKQSFSFHPEFNLIVGENGSGKTSLFTLLTIVLSGWIGNICKIPSKESISFNEYDLRNIVVEYSGELRDNRATFYRIRADWNGLPTTEGKEETSFWNACYESYGRSGKIRPRHELSHINNDFIAFRESHADFTMPLFAAYRCNRLWKPNTSKDKVKTVRKAMEERYERADGYLGWAYAYADDNILMSWIQKLDIIAYQENTKPLGWQVMQNALKASLDSFDLLHFRAKEGQLIILFKDGRRIPFNQLSDGQRTLFAMIGDMVRRAVLLNPQLGEKVLEETPGVVLIDELDLHLHPKWQRRIIEDLRRTFPKIQFICTTHSPFLIQSLREGKLIQLDGETGEEYSDASLEDIAENIQGIEMPQKSLRFTQMMEAAEAYYKRLHECADETDPQTQSLKQRLDELSIPFSDDPAFAAFLKFERDTLVAKEEKEG